jgi:hypothetical protein
MAVTVELLKGQRLGGGTRSAYECSYRIDGVAATTTEAAFAEADAALLADVPATWNGLNLTDYTIEALTDSTFAASVRYSSQELSSDGATEYSFQIGAESRRITHSRQTTAYARSGETAPDFHGAIDVRDDGTIQGADILVPTSRFSYAKLMTPAVFDAAYQEAVEDVVGRVCDDAFAGRAAGSVMFLGASGSGKMGEFVRVTFEFVKGIEETRTYGEIEDVVIPPFHHAWPLYERVHDSSGNAIATDVKAVYVERIFDEADFSALGI